MFSARVRRAVGVTMWATCFLKFCPYRWDDKNYRFKRANRRHLFLHYVVLIFESAVTAFQYIRFITMIGNSAPRPFIMAFIFAIARTMEMLCYIQFCYKRDEIMFFANAVFAYMEQSRKKKIMHQIEPKTKQKLVLDFNQIMVSISSVLVFINPPMHALLILNTPCVRHFVSSIILECEHDMDHSQPFHLKLPLIILENFLVMSLLQVITFNWTLIFIGSAWVKHILREVKEEALSLDRSVRAIGQEKFRVAQTIIRHLNEAFKIYLATSPSLILAVLVLLLFSTLRFAEVDMTSYLMYPSCSARCIFESYSLLAYAGHVNNMSGEVIRNFKLSANAKEPSSNHDRQFRKSCKKLTINAASMYTFESTIVLTTIHNCSESTFNLMVAYK